MCYHLNNQWNMGVLQNHRPTDRPSTDPLAANHRPTASAPPTHRQPPTDSPKGPPPTHRLPTHQPTYNWPPTLCFTKIILTESPLDQFFQ